MEVVRDGTNIQEAVDGGLHMSDEMGFTIKIEGMRKQSVTAKRAFRDKSGTPAIFAIGKDAKKQNRISNTNTVSRFFACWTIFHGFLLSADFFQNKLFPKQYFRKKQQSDR